MTERSAAPRPPSAAPPRSLGELAALCGAELVGDAAREIRGPAGLADARPDEVSFLASERYRPLLATTRAAAVLVARELEVGREDLALLRCDDPSRAFSALIQAFAPPQEELVGRHPSAVVDPTAELADDVALGPWVQVGPGARLGPGVRVEAGCVVGAGCAIGAGTRLHPRVVLYPRVTVGERCVLHAGCVVGSEGFGFEPTAAGWEKIPQCGTVVLEDEVELGAGATVDRARFGATRLGRGTKVDNLVHVAHNVEVGEASLLCGQVGLAGSARVGSRTVLAGKVGVNGHVTIGDRVRVGAQAGVFGDLASDQEYLGWPARPRREALRRLALVQRLPELVARLERLERAAAERASAAEERA